MTVNVSGCMHNYMDYRHMMRVFGSFFGKLEMTRGSRGKRNMLYALSNVADSRLSYYEPGVMNEKKMRIREWTRKR